MAGPINPPKLEWDWPQTNSDGSPLTDLAKAEIDVATSATGPWTLTATVPAPAPDPAAGAIGSSLTSSWGLTTDGQYYASIRAVDASGNSGVRSAVLPFVRSVIAPASVGNPRFSPPTTVTLTGTATDNVGVTRVAWANDRGGTGDAQGTSNWSANVPVQSGTNIITVKAYDAAGNIGQAQVTVQGVASDG